MKRPDTGLPLTGGSVAVWLHHLRTCEAEGQTTTANGAKGSG